jgi:hypothetical protein
MTKLVIQYLYFGFSPKIMSGVIVLALRPNDRNEVQ